MPEIEEVEWVSLLSREVILNSALDINNYRIQHTSI